MPDSAFSSSVAYGEAFSQHLQQRLFLPFLAADLGDDLLGQHVQRRFWDLQRVELTTANAIEQGGAFDQVVAGGGE